MTAPQRTPISLLQELCMQHCVTADYKLMSVEGAYHAPTFMYRVQVGENVTTSTGASKKKAKHAAALSILQKLLTEEGGYAEGFDSEGIKITASNLLEIMSDPTAETTIEEDGQKNPVGELQEQCMKRHWQPPFYETKEETGLPHDKKFTMECSVGSITELGKEIILFELGTGKSKRLAKREAAKKMLDKIQEMDKGRKSETDKISNVSDNSIDVPLSRNIDSLQKSEEESNGHDVHVSSDEGTLEKSYDTLRHSIEDLNISVKKENGTNGIDPNDNLN